MSNEIEFSLSAGAIRVSKFSTSEAKIANIKESFNEINFKLRFNTGIEINPETEISTVVFSVAYYYDNENAIDNILDLTVEMDFYVKPFNDCTSKNSNGKLKFVDDYIATLIAGITYSTARGILYERTKGTKLQSTILPVIDPINLIGIRREQSSQVSD